MLAHNDSTTQNYTIEEIFSGNFSATEHLRQRCLYPGLYAKHLDRWLDYFSSSQLILIDSKRLRYQPESVMRELFTQLNVINKTFDFSKRLKFVPEKGFYCVIQENNHQKCLGQSKGRKYNSMPESVREYLNKFYKGPNYALKKLLIKYNFTLPSFLFT